MKINDVIERNYASFHKMLKNSDETVYDSLTYEDMLHNVLITSIKKFENIDIEESEGYEYIKKTLLEEILFSKKRKGNQKMIFEEDYSKYTNQ